MKKLLFAIAFLGSLLPASAQWKKQFWGSIALRTDKVLELEMKLTKEGERLSGTYYYTSNGGDMMVTGKLSGSAIELQESNNAGLVTGKFKGVYKADSALIRGYWYTADEKKSYLFELREQEWTDYKIIIKEEKHQKTVGRLNCKAEYEFPEMRENANVAAQYLFNQEVKSNKNTFSAPQSDGDYPDYCEGPSDNQYITCAYKNNYFISLGVTTSVFECGAGAMNYISSIVIDLKNNRRLEMKDIFKTGYEKPLRDLINQKIKAMAKSDGEDYSEFYIGSEEAVSERCTGFYFDERMMSFFLPRPGAVNNIMGLDDVEIKYSEIKHLFNPESIVSKWLKDTGK